MRNLNPIENTAMIRRASDGAFLGSGVLYRYCSVVLTAEHVLRDVEGSDIVVEFPNSRAAGQVFRALTKNDHGSADFSILTIEPPDERLVTWVHTEFWEEPSYGIDLMTFGYPQVFDGTAIEPVARFLKGYNQRFVWHHSHLGYRYQAMELSFGCPSGLSGSQIVNLAMHGRLYGIVTENFEAGTQLHSISEVSDDGKEFRETTHSVINYGIGLYLPPLAEWVDGIVPRVTSTELERRAANQRLWND